MQWLAKHPIPADATFEQKMADLNDSTFASISTTDQSFFEILRSWAGLPKQTGYRRENLGSEAADVIAMQKGIVDAAFHSPPASIEMVEQGYAKLLVDRRDVPGFNNIAYDLLTTTSTYAEQHPEITMAVATAIAEALNFMRDHRDETLAIEQKHFQKLDKVVLQKSLEFVSFAKDGMQSQKAWDSAVALAQQTGSIQGITEAPEGVYWTNKYIDASKLGK
jgi:ABC-type nitrate/sulfonate/bicarbonate transport system substrate-binding protein